MPAWDEVGSYLLHDVLTYADWNDDSKDVASLSYSKDVPSLRKERGAHQIMTVDEAVAYVGTDFVLPLHPLCGGVPPDVAWPYLRRVADEVMPASSPTPVPRNDHSDPHRCTPDRGEHRCGDPRRRPP